MIKSSWMVVAAAWAGAAVISILFNDALRTEYFTPEYGQSKDCTALLAESQRAKDISDAKEVEAPSLAPNGLDERLSEVEHLIAELKHELLSIPTKTQVTPTDLDLRTAHKLVKPSGLVLDESWFWELEGPVEMALGAINLAMKSVECRGTWCRLELPDGAGVSAGTIDELLLFDEFSQAHGSDVIVRTPRSGPNRGRGFFVSAYE